MNIAKKWIFGVVYTHLHQQGNCNYMCQLAKPQTVIIHSSFSHHD